MRRNKNTEAHDKNSEHLTGIVARTFHHYFFLFYFFFLLMMSLISSSNSYSKPLLNLRERDGTYRHAYHWVDAKQNNNRLKWNSPEPLREPVRTGQLTPAHWMRSTGNVSYTVTRRESSSYTECTLYVLPGGLPCIDDVLGLREGFLQLSSLRDVIQIVCVVLAPPG